jgi:hypothetical protein
MTCQVKPQNVCCRLFVLVHYNIHYNKECTLGKFILLYTAKLHSLVYYIYIYIYIYIYLQFIAPLWNILNILFQVLV